MDCVDKCINFLSHLYICVPIVCRVYSLFNFHFSIIMVNTENMHDPCLWFLIHHMHRLCINSNDLHIRPLHFPTGWTMTLYIPMVLYSREWGLVCSKFLILSPVWIFKFNLSDLNKGPEHTFGLLILEWMALQQHGVLVLTTYIYLLMCHYCLKFFVM